MTQALLHPSPRRSLPLVDQVEVALVQVASPSSEAAGDRRARIRGMLQGLDGVDLVVLPELWPTGYQGLDWSTSQAEPLDGPTVELCREVARERRMYIAGGSFLERANDGRCYNTSFLVGTNGQLEHVYRKIHLFSYRSQEAQVLSAGDQVSTVDLGLATYGAAICYDLRFPGLWDRLGSLAPELIVLPASWPAARAEHWRVLTTARAIEAQAYVLACNATKKATASGAEAGGGCGFSRVIDPTGVVVAELGVEESVLRTTIDLSQVRRWRAEFPITQDRLENYATLRP